ncbi:deSI-like protein At4g17486 [Arachis stenosperma]|uniref:deSI-like protein At4g17486 n=1 Tax=Arachis hypogaea TaxID=3818 RepID=UPI0010FC4AE7|nr:deSI-like protein At4g17486 [Arachis hypogaea]XP_029151047.1 deSI-like protein At4g17486 [Arachis hypogaea]XP_057724175.1 deSI-like protein At4g17486 [Arachis stenosperma]
MGWRKGRRRKKRSSGCEPVYLNVYDVSPTNGYSYWLGLGVYHSGVEVYGVEYAFGAHESSWSGIFEGEPKKCEGFKFRKRVMIGKTGMGESEVKAVMEELGGEYRGNAYNLISKNCNHFSNAASRRLTGKSIPAWVNRLAKFGMCCKCVVPPVRLDATMANTHRTINCDNMPTCQLPAYRETLEPHQYK